MSVFGIVGDMVQRLAAAVVFLVLVALVLAAVFAVFGLLMLATQGHV